MLLLQLSHKTTLTRSTEYREDSRSIKAMTAGSWDGSDILDLNLNTVMVIEFFFPQSPDFEGHCILLLRKAGGDIFSG